MPANGHPSCPGSTPASPVPALTVPVGRIGLLKGEDDNAGRVTVAPGIEWRVVFPLPRAHKRRQTETSIVLLFADGFFNDRLLLGASEQSGEFR